jgi:hypothetical protein
MMMRNIATSVVCALLSCFGADAYAQGSPDAALRPMAVDNAERGADALLDATIPGVADELTRQLARMPLLPDELSDEQQVLLRQKTRELMALVVSAMEQRWEPREPVTLPSNVQAQMDETIRRSVAYRRGEIGAERASTRVVIAAALRERFSAEQLAEIADFLETPHGRALSYRLSVWIVQRAPMDLSVFTTEERDAISAFMETPTGSVYNQAMPEVIDFTVEQLRLNVMAHGRELMLEFAAAICEVAGPECGA